MTNADRHPSGIVQYVERSGSTRSGGSRDSELVRRVRPRVDNLAGEQYEPGVVMSDQVEKRAVDLEIEVGAGTRRDVNRGECCGCSRDGSEFVDGDVGSVVALRKNRGRVGTDTGIGPGFGPDLVEPGSKVYSGVALPLGKLDGCLLYTSPSPRDRG